MILHSELADAENHADFVIGLAVADPMQDLGFTLAQNALFAGCFGRAPLGSGHGSHASFLSCDDGIATVGYAAGRVVNMRQENVEHAAGFLIKGAPGAEHDVDHIDAGTLVVNALRHDRMHIAQGAMQIALAAAVENHAGGSLQGEYGTAMLLPAIEETADQVGDVALRSFSTLQP